MKKLHLILAATLLLGSLSAQADDRCYEMRVYYANEGKLDALNARFRDHTCRLFEKHGLTNIGYWVPVENPDNKLVYIIASPNREAHKKSWKAFINDPDWKKAYAESTADGKLIHKVESTFMKPTDYSMVPSPDAQSPERAFELRIYTTNEGKLDGLNARFRDHTVELFAKHGITNIAYWTPMDKNKGADNKLIYIIAHKDQEARNASFKAFSQDPRWQTARKASEENGKLLVKKGVDATMMKPTDYSPLK
jgi:hypothetical protein